MRNYSQFVCTLYDEVGPVGRIGRGTHYSVLRTLACRSIKDGLPLDAPLIQDLAVIWDEDHDVRIFEVLDLIVQHNLLYPVLFLGERKAMLSVVVSCQFGGDLKEFADRVGTITSTLADPWDVSVEVWTGKAPSTIISDKDQKTAAYLQNIDNLWGLGHKAFPVKCEENPTVKPSPMAPQVSMDTKQFDIAMMEIYRRARKEAKYNATRFLQMLHDHGGLETARILLHTPNVSDGYTELWQRNRLDLTVEALVIQPQWRELFTDNEKVIARKRLEEYKFNFDA